MRHDSRVPRHAMGLLKKLFGGSAAEPDTQPASSQFHESETTAQQKGSANAPRRELVQLVLRDTMRKHGIPSDWMDCRILSVVTRKRVSGMHVQFIVSKGQTRLLDFVHSFQESFWEEIEKFEPRARDWLFSLAWQFEGPAPRAKPSKPEAAAEWLDGDTQPPDEPADELRSDLQALYAIRDEALKQSAEQTSRAGAPGPNAGPGS
jgi:hypothetical protein